MKFNIMKPLMAAVLLASATAAMPQTVIKGRVVSQSSSDAIAGASVTLLKDDTVPAAQTMTASNGSFQINSDMSGNKIILVSMTGYKPERVAVIGGEDDVTDIGYIFLAESAVNLNEITVYGSGIIEKVDKFIVLPGKDQVERSARSIDLFAQLDLPGLRTDPILERVTVEDRTPVYQINGRQQPLQQSRHTLYRQRLFRNNQRGAARQAARRLHLRQRTKRSVGEIHQRQPARLFQPQKIGVHTLLQRQLARLRQMEKQCQRIVHIARCDNLTRPIRL